MLNIEIKNEKKIKIFNLKGRFDGYGASLFDEKTETIKDDLKFWILNFTNVVFLSSAGIRSLIKTEKCLRKISASLYLAGLNSDLKKVLKLTGLLHMFKIYDTLQEALDLINRTTSINETFAQIEERKYIIKWLEPQDSFLDFWEISDSSVCEFNADKLIPTNLKELEFAFGIGGIGHSRIQGFETLGEFISTPFFAGVMPADEHNLSDFIISENPSETPFFVFSGIGLSGKPEIIIESDSEIELNKIIFDYFQIIKKENADSLIMGFIILAESENVTGSFFKTKEDILTEKYHIEDSNEKKGILLIGTAIEKSILKLAVNKNFLHQIQKFPLDENFYFHGHCVILNKLIQTEISLEPLTTIRQNIKLENLEKVFHLNPDTKLKNAKTWISIPKNIRSSDEKRLKIQSDSELKNDWEIIIRKIYSEAGEVILSELQGGFTSKTFQVTSFDKDGRRLLPTVLKIGSIKDTENEVNAYHNYVIKFILNNSTTIMGTTFHGDFGGLRYNFVGINGPDSKLTWLTDYYKKLPAEKLIPIFDRIFTDVLKPWYGQPKWELIYPFKEHSPFEMFPSIFESLETNLGISADEKTIFCEELNTELPNPYHFLKYEYPKQKEFSKLWYKSITHGDLNMQNILLDEVENIYIIDFSETKVRNIISDFARLEPIFKIEMTKLETETDLKNLLEFEAGLADANSIKDIPKFIYRGNDPMVKKAYKMICKVREYANIVTLFDDDIVPYLIAILEWTYPIVCYGSVGQIEKKYALYSAALICKKIMEVT
ncbi:MAG: STAS domain-containing protein [Armatimonadetes bacterium]|nr:STAS domain-containing protein [Armatimonadota bacterium]